MLVQRLEARCSPTLMHFKGPVLVGLTEKTEFLRYHVNILSVFQYVMFRSEWRWCWNATESLSLQFHLHLCKWSPNMFLYKHTCVCMFLSCCGETPRQEKSREQIHFHMSFNYQNQRGGLSERLVLPAWRPSRHTFTAALRSTRADQRPHSDWFSWFYLYCFYHCYCASCLVVQREATATLQQWQPSRSKLQLCVAPHLQFKEPWWLFAASPFCTCYSCGLVWNIWSHFPIILCVRAVKNTKNISASEQASCSFWVNVLTWRICTGIANDSMISELFEDTITPKKENVIDSYWTTCIV